MGLLYCLGWLEPCGTFGLSESRAPSRPVLAPGLPRGGPGSEAPVCEKTEVWEKEELKVCLSSGVPRVPEVPRLALALGLGLSAARLPFVSRAGSWHRAAPCRGERREQLEATRVPALLHGPETEVLVRAPSSLPPRSLQRGAQEGRTPGREGFCQGEGGRRPSLALRLTSTWTKCKPHAESQASLPAGLEERGRGPQGVGGSPLHPISASCSPKWKPLVGTARPPALLTPC